MASSKYYLAAMLCLVMTSVQGAKVSDTSCGGSGASSCPTNSACETNKCKCSTGFVEDTDDGSTCVKVVSQTECSDKGTECKSIQNSACDVPHLKCKCDTGFTEVANTCVKGSSATTIRIASVTMIGSVLLVFCYRLL